MNCGDRPSSALLQLLAMFYLSAGFVTPKRLKKLIEKIDLKNPSVSCTFPAQLCKLLIINGAGEGNRTLVYIVV